MNKELIKVGFCVAYDWYLLKYSLPLIYNEADIICLSIDKDRISWSGNVFSWDETGFRAMVDVLDKGKKIQIIEDNYHLLDLSPMENEVRQRNKIAEFLGVGGWHLQLDTDEFFLNFNGFVAFLRNFQPKRKVNVVCPWITLYKQDTEGYYYIKPTKFNQVEFIQVATKWPSYEYGRRNGYFNVKTNFAILHLSWARSDKEILEKLNNWGHKNDFDINAYYNLWRALNKNNYTTYKNFNHIRPENWPAVGFILAKDIESLISSAGMSMPLPINAFQLKLENSVWVSRFKSLGIKK